MQSKLQAEQTINPYIDTLFDSGKILKATKKEQLIDFSTVPTKK